MIGIISHPACVLHEISPGHPECPDRIRVIEKALKKSKLEPFLKYYNAIPARKTDLIEAHDINYVDFIFNNAPKVGIFQIDADTIMNPHSLQAALLAAGGAMEAVDLVMKGEIKQAFCNGRPPGHHAEKARAMGFCFFNNVAIAVLHAINQYKLERIAIVDFDVHHGNGTEDIFLEDDRVMLCSSYQYPFYPMTPIEENSHLLHLPLAAGTRGLEFRKLFAQKFLPKLEEFQPEFIFISAGFDAHAIDPLANLKFMEEDYYWLGKEIYELAEQSCKGRIVSCLEGGYALKVLGQCVVAHLAPFVGISFDELFL